MDLSSFDGVIAVGGDGTFNEIANALIRRVNSEQKVDVDDPEAELKSLTTRVGIIPCGSTDCMAFSTMGKYTFLSVTTCVYFTASRMESLAAVIELIIPSLLTLETSSFFIIRVCHDAVISCANVVEVDGGKYW